MLYACLKVIIGFYRRFFCRHVIIDKPEMMKLEGPLIIACNHPNSFLDAVIIDLIFKEPVWSLTRGDAFINKGVRKLFFKLRMLPVYRPSEGVENLGENYRTFDECIEIFRRNGVVLIFSEGLCVNEWHLRPLKKGTARLAMQCRDSGIPLRVLPVGINYSSFRRFGKNVFIRVGNIISMEDFEKKGGEGPRYQAFNNRLSEELRPLVFEIKSEDRERQRELLAIHVPFIKKMLLTLPAFIGYLLHAPLYLPIRAWVLKKYNDTVHVDSMLVALPFFLYPLYLLFLLFLLHILTQSWWALLLLVAIPFCGWAYINLKKQMDR